MSWQPPIGWVPDSVLNGIVSGEQPPQYLLDAMRSGGFLDASGNLLPQYRWDPNTQSVVENSYGGGSYGFGDIPDPSLGTNVVLPTTRTGRSDVIGGTQIDNPYGVGGEAYNFSGVPFIGSPSGGNLFVSDDPAAIAEYNHDRRTRAWQGAARVGALVGGAAALGGTAWGQGAGAGGGTGSATVSTSNTAAGVAAPAAGPSLAAIEGWAPAAGPSLAAIEGWAPAAGPSLAAIEGWAPAAAAGGGGAAGGAGSAGGALSGLNWTTLVPSIVSGVTGILGANAQADAASDAARLSREMFDIARGDALPRIEAGNRAVGVLDAVQGLTTGTPDLSRFTQSPDYQFNLQQGTQAGERALAAMGLRQSGPAVKEAERFASGLASREYGSFIDRLLATAGLGTTGAAQSASAGAANASIGGNAIQNRGAARSSGYGAVNDAVQGGIGNYLFQQYLNRYPVPG